MAAVETGVAALDRALGGGYRPGEVSLIYGEEKSGRTSFALQASLFVLRRDMRVVWIDCGGHLHPERVFQVFSDSQVDGKNMMLSVPRDFEEQTRVIETLPLYLPDGTGLVVFENFNMLHRVDGFLAVEKNRRMFKDLNFQLAYLKGVVMRRRLPLIATAQVHEALDKSEEATLPAASRISMYWADIVLRTRNWSVPALKIVSVERGWRSKVSDIMFRVTQSGVSGVRSSASIDRKSAKR